MFLLLISVQLQAGLYQILKLRLTPVQDPASYGAIWCSSLVVAHAALTALQDRHLPACGGGDIDVPIVSSYVPLKGTTLDYICSPFPEKGT